MFNKQEFIEEMLLTEINLRRYQFQFYIILDKNNNSTHTNSLGKTYIIFQNTESTDIIAIPYELGKFNLANILNLKQVKIDFPNVILTTSDNTIYRGSLLIHNKLNTAYDFMTTSLFASPNHDEVYYVNLTDDNQTIQDFLSSPTGTTFSSHGQNPTLDFSEKVYNNIQHENILIFALDCNSTIQLDTSTNQIYIFEKDSYLSNAQFTLSDNNSQISIRELDGTTHKGFRISNTFLSNFKSGNKFSSCRENPTLDFRKKDSNSNSLENTLCGTKAGSRDCGEIFSSHGSNFGSRVGGLNPISTQVYSYSEHRGSGSLKTTNKIKGVIDVAYRVEGLDSDLEFVIGETNGKTWVGIPKGNNKLEFTGNDYRISHVMGKIIKIIEIDKDGKEEDLGDFLIMKSEVVMDEILRKWL